MTSQPSLTTALLLVDLQNAFCLPEGSFQKRFGPLHNLPQTLEACRQLHALAESRAAFTIFTQLQFSPDYSDAGLLVHSLAPSIKQLGAYVEGGWDAAITQAAPKPRAADVILRKTRYDPFINTLLQDLLRKHAVSHLLIAGILTNVCVEAAARSAFDRDFHVTIVQDATTALTLESKLTSLGTLGKHYARVLPASSPDIWHPPPF